MWNETGDYPFVSKLRNDLGIAVLFITHDISLLQDFATKIYVMYQGELVDETHAYGKRLFQLSQNSWRRNDDVRI
ncbi:hypothetical protein [Fusobacterium necrophorum]|uniref:hypothetical protein n=1 Tax=Fusobacterium necrophorum TaxID=859 RepID=UPI0030A80AC5